MILLIIALVVVFLWATGASSGWAISYAREGITNVAHRQEIEGINKIGKWYQDRVQELEEENRQLAEQIVAAGALPRLAMPLPGTDEYAEYAYDPTGLVREKLDSRDLAVG